MTRIGAPYLIGVAWSSAPSASSASLDGCGLVGRVVADLRHLLGRLLLGDLFGDAPSEGPFLHDQLVQRLGSVIQILGRGGEGEQEKGGSAQRRSNQPSMAQTRTTAPSCTSDSWKLYEISPTVVWGTIYYRAFGLGVLFLTC